MSFELETLRTEEGRREYYHYDHSKPETLVHHAEPFLDPAYNQELLELYGTDQHGDQKIRFVWCGLIEAEQYRIVGDDILPYTGKKYPYMRIREHYGFSFMDDKGVKTIVRSEDAIPDGKVFTPEFRFDDLGIMRFAIELKFTMEELVQLQIYPHPDDPKAELYRQDKQGRFIKNKPDPNGEYRFASYVETEDRKYRDVSRHDLDQITQIVSANMNETAMEHIERKRVQAEKLEKKLEVDKFRKASDIIADAIPRVEKKLAKGEIIYSRF